ncbi:MAG: cell division protein FtsZ [Christensenellaceae bacterium]
MINNFGDNDNYGAGYGYGSYGEQPAAPVQEPLANNLSGVAKIKVIGVGGAGNNAVNRLIESGLKSAEYIVVNTDNQALARSKATNRIQIGAKLTKGLGAGADPSVGKAAAEESKDIIQNVLKDTDLLFITAGMGGGTGTGAAPIIAKIAKDMKILTVAVVTLPFTFEAKRRMDNAVVGVEELRKSVDSIIIIPNDKIREVVPKGTPFPEALKVADEVLRQGIRGIAELIVNPSLINLDFADVRTTLKARGLAHMGIGVAKGEKRISDAVRCAVCSPLLNTTIEGASSVILNVVGGKDLSLDEVWMAADLVKGVIDFSANVIFGACIDNVSDEVKWSSLRRASPRADDRYGPGRPLSYGAQVSSCRKIDAAATVWAEPTWPGNAPHSRSRAAVLSRLGQNVNNHTALIMRVTERGNSQRIYAESLSADGRSTAPTAPSPMQTRVVSLHRRGGQYRMPPTAKSRQPRPNRSFEPDDPISIRPALPLLRRQTKTSPQVCGLFH